MPAYQRLEVTEVGDVTIVRFRSRRITEDIDIQELGSEMFSLVENEKREKLLLNFSTVDFLGSAALGPEPSSTETFTWESPRATIVQWKSASQPLPMARSRTSSG